MGIGSIGGGGAGGFTLGPAQNVFSGADRTAAEAARDLYDTNNPGWIDDYDADTNLNIRLEYTEGVDAVALYQVTDGASNWLDNSSSVGVRGQDGGATNFASITTEGQVPSLSSDLVNYEYSGSTVDPATGETTFDQTINVPAGSITVGTTMELSEGGQDLVIADLVKGQMAFSVNSDFTDATGADLPNYVDFGEPQSVELQPVFDTTITTNPLTVVFAVSVTPATNFRLIDQITLKTNGPMINTRFKVTDVATGLVLRYAPNKSAYDGDGNGFDLITGDNTFFLAETGTDGSGDFYLGYVPFVTEDGQDLEIQIVADTVDLLGDSSEVPYLAQEFHDGPLKEIGLKEYTDRVQTTGLLEGGVMSAASGTTLDWTSGRGQIIDYTNPEEAILTDVTWDAVAGLTPDNLATDGTTVFGYDSTGTLVQKLDTAIAISDSHEVIWFGSATHLSSTITNVITAPGNMGYDGIGSFGDFINLVIGPANVDGNIYGPNGANLNIDVLGGNAFILGSNFRNDPTLSDIVTLPNSTALTFFKVYRSAGAGLSVIYDGAPTALIDPTQYDDGSGTLQAVASNRWTIQRIFRSRDGGTVVAYGQEEFVSKALALEALGSEAFQEKVPLPLTVFRGSLVVSEAATDLSDTGQAEFFAQSSFRIAGAQSATSTIPGVTSPGGVDTSIQFNNGGVFGGDSNFLWDSTLKTMVLQSPALGSTTIEFVDSNDDLKGTITYNESADEFRIDALNGITEIILNDVVEVFKGATDGRIDVKANTAAGSALLTLSAGGGGTGLSLEYDDGSDESNIISEVGHLTIGTDGTDTNITLSPDGGVGIKIDPTAGYSLDVYAAGTDIVGLYSNKAVTLEIAAHGGTSSTNFIMNKGDAGLNQSEFAMYNDDNAVVLDRLFRMGFADDIITSGGLTIWKERNNVAVGTYDRPDSVFTVSEDTTETGDQAGITIIQEGTGDAILQYLLTGSGQRWVMGASNAGGDAFEISSSLNLGSDTRFIINTTGEAKIPLSLMVGDTANPTSPLHIYEDTTNTDATAGVTIEQDGEADSVLHYVLTGIQTISTGVDYSGSGHYKISGSDDLGTDAILTATIAGRVGVGSEEPASTFHVYDDNTFTGSTIGLTIEQADTGDALAQWHLSGGVRYLAGIDNSDSDLFKIEYGGFLSTDAAIQVDTTNKVGVGIAPVSKLHVYQDDAVTGTGGGITIEQDGGGDAMLQYLLTGGQRWVAGIDNSDNDTYKIAASNDLGTDTVLKLDRTNGVCLTIDNTSIINWELAAGLELINEDGTDDTYTSVVHRGISNIAAGMLFKNDDYSEDYSHIIFGARDANGLEDHALIIKPAHTEIVNSTNTPYGGQGQVQNRLTHSQELDNAAWVPGSTDAPVVTANNAIAPDGTMTADTLSFPGPGAGLIRQGTLGLIEDDIYNVSGWVRHVSGGTQLTARLDTDNTDPWIADSRWQRFSSDIVQGSGGPWFDLFVFAAHAPAVFEVWGLQISDGTGEKPYLKTGELELLTQTQGATVNNDLYVSDGIYKNTHEVATNGPEVVEVWTLDDMPRVGGTGDVIPEYKLYRFMQGIDWGTTRMLLENDAYALFEGADVFVTSQTYSGTDPWIYGEGTIRCVGNGMTWQLNSDNATMFDITAGGWGMDYSSLIAAGDNCSLGTIVSPKVTDPLLGARFISTRSLFQGFKTGLTLIQPGNIHIDISFFYDAADAVGPMLSVIGMGKAGVIESTEVTMSSATSEFLYISPITEAPVTCMNVTLADEQAFFTTGTTGAITLFADASVPAEAVTSVTDNAGVARFNFAAPPTLYVGQKVVMSTFTNYDNVTATITATGAGYFETDVDYNGADTGSFLSNSVTVTSAAHGLSELDAVLITETMEYNHGSTIYNVVAGAFQVNMDWHTAETSGTWNDSSLDHTSKYVNTFNNGEQQDSNPAPSFNVADNATTTTTTTGWGAVVFGTAGVALVAGNTNQNFTLIDDISGLIRYEGIDPLTLKMNPSISMVKTGGAVEHQFRLFKTTGTPAFDPHTVKRSISTSTGAASLNCSAFLNPGDEFRLEVKATTTGSTITITDFSL